MIWLDADEISFPDPEQYNPEDGLVAIGGDLSQERLLFAYQLGIFPWYNEDEEILWWCPDPRFVLFPNELNISKSTRKILKDNIFQFTENHCFEEVIRQCKTTERKGQNGTWINEELISSFLKLHKIGVAKSFEAWQNNELVGGFYGLEIGGVFCGESMFSKVSNASKSCFIHFTKQYEKKWTLIDCQIHSDHLERLGAKMIPKKDYLKFLKTQTN